MRFEISKKYKKLWLIFGFNPEAGLTLREFHKRAPSDEANGYRKDGSDFNKPYSQFIERLNHNRWKSKGWRWYSKSYRCKNNP